MVKTSNSRFTFFRSTAGDDASGTRRSFLKYTSLAAIGSVMGGKGTVAWTADAQPQASQYPVQLGCGYLSTGRLVRTRIADLAASTPQWSAQGDHWFDMELVDSHSTYEERTTASAQIGVAAGVAGGDVQASASKFFRSEKNAVHLIAWKKVVLGDYTLTTPTVTTDVASETSPWNFVRRFGDQFIDRVTLGAELALVYELQFKTETEAREFSIKGERPLQSSFGKCPISPGYRQQFPRRESVSPWILQWRYVIAPNYWKRNSCRSEQLGCREPTQFLGYV